MICEQSEWTGNPGPLKFQQISAAESEIELRWGHVEISNGADCLRRKVMLRSVSLPGAAYRSLASIIEDNENAVSL